MLNIGPDALGDVPEESVNNLLEVELRCEKLLVLGDKTDYKNQLPV